MSTEQAVEPSPAAAGSPGAPASDPVAAKDTPLTKLASQLSDITQRAGHSEMWGVQLSNLDHIPTKVVLQKFLRANNGDSAAAKDQLLSALQWRKDMRPEQLVTQAFDKKKFGDLGFVTVHQDKDGKETIVTWNIYGAVKDKKATFANVKE